MSAQSPRAVNAAVSSKTERSAPPSLISARSITIATFRLIVRIITLIRSACKWDGPAVFSIVSGHSFCSGDDFSNEGFVLVSELALRRVGEVEPQPVRI